MQMQKGFLVLQEHFVCDSYVSFPQLFEKSVLICYRCYGDFISKKLLYKYLNGIGNINKSLISLESG